MAAISVIEFIVYGLIAYSSMLMLIISTIKEVPTTRFLSIARSIYFIPGMVCAAILGSSGVDIITQSTTNIIKNLNNTETWRETVTQSIVLQNYVWVYVHYMIFIVLLAYVAFQILILLTKHDKMTEV